MNIINIKDIMDARYANNQLTEYEQGIYLDTIEKLNKRSVVRDFTKGQYRTMEY